MTVTEDAPAAAPASESTAPDPLPRPASPPSSGTGDHKVVGRLWLVAALVHLVLVGVVNVLRVGRADRHRQFDVLGADWIVQADTFRFIGGSSCFLLPLTIGVATSSCPSRSAPPPSPSPERPPRPPGRYLLGGGLLVASYAMTAGPAAPTATASALRRGLRPRPVSLGSRGSASSPRCSPCGPRAWACARLPLFAWSTLVAGGVWILTLPVLVGLARAQLPRPPLRRLPRRQHRPAVFDRISWAFGTPAVYAFAIPVLGFVGSVVPVFAQTRHHLHRVAMGLIGALGVLQLRRLDGPEPRRPACRGSTRPRGSLVSIAALVPAPRPRRALGRHRAAGQARPRQPAPVRRRRRCSSLLLGVAAGAVQAIEPIETLRRRRRRHHAVRHLLVQRRHRLLFVAGDHRRRRRRRVLGPQDPRHPPPRGRRPPRGAAPARRRCRRRASPTLAAGLLGEPGPAELAAVDNLDTIETLNLLPTAGDAVLGLAGARPAPGPRCGRSPAGRGGRGRSVGRAHARVGHRLAPAVGNFASAPGHVRGPLYDARHAAQEAEA